MQDVRNQRKKTIIPNLMDSEIQVVFYKQNLFGTQSQCCLTFPWTESQILLKCCLIYTDTLFVSIILFLLLDLGLFLSFLCGLFFFIIFIFVITIHIISLKQTLFFSLILEYIPLFFLNSHCNIVSMRMKRCGNRSSRPSGGCFWRKRIVVRYQKFSLRVI